jgi:ADP-ribose pyrophosphatase YjhB (NUDIX family)
LEHRVRAAVILIEQGKLLLVKHVDPATGGAWWIPPGGGLLPEDQSIVDCARREVHEEAGLGVTVGKLIYLREFIEIQPGVHHIELFFLGRDPEGELTMEHIKGKGPDEEFIRELAWLGKSEMRGLTVYPEHLTDGFWGDLEAGFPEARYLGVHADQGSG